MERIPTISEDNDDTCRICLEANDSTSILPCACKEKLHRGCLDIWRVQCVDDSKCEVCHTEYEFEPRTWAPRWPTRLRIWRDLFAVGIRVCDSNWFSGHTLTTYYPDLKNSDDGPFAECLLVIRVTEIHYLL